MPQDPAPSHSAQKRPAQRLHKQDIQKGSRQPDAENGGSKKGGRNGRSGSRGDPDESSSSRHQGKRPGGSRRDGSVQGEETFESKPKDRARERQSVSNEAPEPKRGKLIEFSDDEEGDRSQLQAKPAHPQKAMASAMSKQSAKPASSSSLLDKYRKKLEGAKFRLLNESLYTGQKSATGLSQSEFDVYHQGFSSQVEKWPTNPVDEIIKRFINPKKRRIDIGDFGCGDAKIGRTKGKVHNVHSFDLVAADESVTPCDIARDGVPLGDNMLDMVIFSLSLMGSDVTSYIAEARRVLKTGGELVIAEVKSRFSEDGEKSAEAMKRGLNKFCAGVRDMGFKMLELDSESNTMFVLIRMSKTGKPVQKEVRIHLKPCEYKRR